MSVDLEIPGTREKRRREHDERMAAQKSVVDITRKANSVIDWLYGRK